MSQPQPQPQPQPGPPPLQPGSDEEALEIHNQCRRDASQSSGHPRPNLVWDDYLAAQATDYASYLASQDLGNQHSSSDQRPNQGENLYSTDGQDGGMAVASDGWGPKEKIFYHGEKIPDGEFEQYGPDYLAYHHQCWHRCC